jgi:hypothetical protein
MAHNEEGKPAVASHACAAYRCKDFSKIDARISAGRSLRAGQVPPEQPALSAGSTIFGDQSFRVCKSLVFSFISSVVQAETTSLSSSYHPISRTLSNMSNETAPIAVGLMGTVSGPSLSALRSLLMGL